MATRNKKTESFIKQHWLSLVALLLVTMSFWWSYELYRFQRLDNKLQAEAQFKLATEIGKLRVCIDNNIRPCDEENLQKYYEN